MIDYDSDMQPDFDDIRFTEDEASGELNYWIENYTTNNATVWVRRVQPSAYDSTIYIYYGNPTATSASNGNTTFIFFDDFSGDLSKWTAVSGSPSVSEGLLLLDPNEEIRTTSTYQATRACSRIRFTSGNGSYDQFYQLYDGTYYSYFQWWHDTSMYCGLQSGEISETYTPTVNTFRTYQMDWKSGQTKFYDEDVLRATLNYNPGTNLDIRYKNEGTGNKFKIDWTFLAKYVELTISVGAEESPPPPNKPLAPFCENQTNPTNLTTFYPRFNAIYTDNDLGDNALYAHIRVGTSAGDNSKWDSGWIDITDQTGGKLGDSERSADITYAGSALSWGATYYWRIRFQDSFGLAGDWSDDQTFTLAIPVRITDVTATPTLVDRKVDVPSSGADDITRVYVVVVDNWWGRDRIENCFVWIQDSTDTVVVDNLQLMDYENIDENTKRFFYDFDPDNSAQCGYFDVKAQVVNNDGMENTKDYTSLGYQLFKVDDLTVSASLDTANPIYQVGVSGSISRASGDATTADEVKVVDNNEGSLDPNSFDATSYKDNYGLVSPTRLHRGDQGIVYVWARDGTLDGKSSSQNYTVQGDNATVTVASITNQPDNSLLSLQVKWSDLGGVGSGTVYIQDRESFQASITSGVGQLVLSHPSWIYSGAAVIKLYDNADRPLWDVSGATFETKSITYAANSFTGDQDNAVVKIKLAYKDGTAPNTAKIRLMVGSTTLPEQGPDENGIVTWGNVNLPDNTSDIQLKLENCYDYRTDYVVNCKDVEDKIAYTESTTCTFAVTDNDRTIYYGNSGTFSGSVVSQSSYITLKLYGNLVHENGSVVDNTSLLTFTPGENKSWNFSNSPLEITNYVLLLYSENWVLMENRSARLNVKLQAPSLSSPDNESGTADSTPTLSWVPVTGADNYTLQYSTLENFASYTENSLSENQFTTPTLAENRYHWRVQANGANLVSSSWVTRNFWVDSSAPTLDNFLINNGASSTNSRNVTLTVGASDAISGVYQVRFKEGNENWGDWQSYATSRGYTLSSGDGKKTVYARVRDRALNESNILNASITLNAPAPSAGPTQTTTPSPTQPTAPDMDPPVLTLLTFIPSEVNTQSLSVLISVSDASPIGEITTTFDGNPITYSLANDVITISLDNLTGGSHAVVVKVSDLEGNRAERTINFTVKLPPQPVPVEENVGENIAVLVKRQRVENVPAGQRVSFTFVAEVTSIILVPSEDMWEMVLGMIEHENPPDIPLPLFDSTKKVYRCFEISLGINGTENYPATLANLRIEFGVEKAWMENENITDVKLYRLVDNAWQPLSTRFACDDFEYSFYEAEVPSFSTFSIVGIRVPVSTVAVPISSPVEAGGSLAGPLVSFGVIAGGIAGGAWYYMRYYMRKRMSKEFVSRRELKEGPWVLELKRSLGVLVEERVRELERRIGTEEEKSAEQAEKVFRKKPARAKSRKSD